MVAIIGFFHSMCGRCCLSVFLFVVSLLTIGEFGIVIALFANLDGNVENIVNYDISSEEQDNKGNDKNKDRRL